MERVEFETRLGHEWLLGFRNTTDFGPVVVLGPGGIYAAYLVEQFQSDSLISVFSPILPSDEKSVLVELKKNALLPLVFGGLKGQKPELEPGLHQAGYPGNATSDPGPEPVGTGSVS